MLTPDVKFTHTNQNIKKKIKLLSKQTSQVSRMLFESLSHLADSLAHCSAISLSSPVEMTERGTWAKENRKETNIKHFYLLTLFFLLVMHGSDGQCPPWLAQHLLNFINGT